MTLTGWFYFFLILQVVHFAGTWKLYIKAGRKAWEAAVPVYNAVVLMKIIRRPWWWVMLLFIPIVNQIMFPVLWVETLRSFGKNSRRDTILALITLGLYIYYVNYTQDVQYAENRDLKPRTTAGEWISSILFAVVAATIVHTYFMQPYTIPTSSLEKTLLVGDYLFVSKYHYGARTPMTPISFPMVHDSIPLVKKITKGRSYLAKPQIPYFRIPGFQKIARNDIVVFSWPTDTLNAFYGLDDGRYYYKPIDKKSNYVKRCVGLPGDSLEVRNGYVYINGEMNDLPDRAKLQFWYNVYTTTPLTRSDFDFFEKRFEITDIGQVSRNPPVYQAAINDKAFDTFKTYQKIDTVVRVSGHGPGVMDPKIFPNDPQYLWNTDHFGPIYIPQAGKTVAITPETIPFYKRIIEVYEGSELGIESTITQSGTQVLLNEKPITEYTFKMDYYWMMGDNRGNSEDARVWGYVPFNHVVGKPVFIWMSWKDGKPRWDRWFTTVGGEGEPVSYFKYFLIALAGWFVFDFYRKRKKKKSGKVSVK